jgi:TonB family protein
MPAGPDPRPNKERRPRWIAWAVVGVAVVVVLAILPLARKRIPYTLGGLHIDTVPERVAVFDHGPVLVVPALFPPGMDGGDSTCVVRVLADTNGTVMDVRVTDSYGRPGLDGCVVRAAYEWQFPRARHKGAKARVWIEMSYTGVWPYYWALVDTSMSIGDTAVVWSEWSGVDTIPGGFRGHAAR